MTETFPPTSEILNDVKIDFRKFLDCENNQIKKKNSQHSQDNLKKKKHLNDFLSPTNHDNDKKEDYLISNRASYCLPPKYRLRQQWTGPTCECLTGHFIFPNTNYSSKNYINESDKIRTRSRYNVSLLSSLFKDIDDMRKEDVMIENKKLKLIKETFNDENISQHLNSTDSRIRDQHRLLRTIKETVKRGDIPDPICVKFCPITQKSRFVPNYEINLNPRDIYWKQFEKMEWELANKRGSLQRARATITTLIQENNKYKFMVRRVAHLFKNDKCYENFPEHSYSKEKNSFEVIPKYFKTDLKPMDYVTLDSEDLQLNEDTICSDIKKLNMVKPKLFDNNNNFDNSSTYYYGEITVPKQKKNNDPINVLLTASVLNEEKNKLYIFEYGEIYETILTNIKNKNIKHKKQKNKTYSFNSLPSTRSNKNLELKKNNDKKKSNDIIHYEFGSLSERHSLESNSSITSFSTL